MLSIFKLNHYVMYYLLQKFPYVRSLFRVRGIIFRHVECFIITYRAIASRMAIKNGTILNISVKHKNEKIETEAVLDDVIIAGTKCCLV